MWCLPPFCCFPVGWLPHRRFSFWLQSEGRCTMCFIHARLQIESQLLFLSSCFATPLLIIFPCLLHRRQGNLPRVEMPTTPLPSGVRLIASLTFSFGGDCRIGVATLAHGQQTSMFQQVVFYRFDTFAGVPNLAVSCCLGLRNCEC